jgi:hypothetical protein
MKSLTPELAKFMKTNESVFKNTVLLRSEVYYFYHRYSYNVEHNYDVSKPSGGRIWPMPAPGLGMSKFGQGRELAVLEVGRGREFHKSMAKLELFRHSGHNPLRIKN